MSSRTTAFGISAAFVIVVGLAWRIPSFSRESKSMERGNLSAEKTAATSRRTVVPSERREPPPMVSIRALMASQRQFGPVDRGREDEIRCALANLLTDNNAEWIVKNLLSDELQTEFGVAALSLWAGKDAVAASLWLAQQRTQSDEQTWAVAHALAKDPVAVEVLGELLPPTTWRETVLEDATYARLPDSPGDALSLAHRMQSGPRQTRVLAAIADEWVARDPATAARWIGSEPDIPLRDELLFSAATSRAFLEPTAALDWTAGIVSPVIYGRAVDKIASMWADPTVDRTAQVAVIAALRHGVVPAENDAGLAGP